MEISIVGITFYASLKDGWFCCTKSAFRCRRNLPSSSQSRPYSSCTRVVIGLCPWIRCWHGVSIMVNHGFVYNVIDDTKNSNPVKYLFKLGHPLCLLKNAIYFLVWRTFKKLIVICSKQPYHEYSWSKREWVCKVSKYPEKLIPINLVYKLEYTIIFVCAIIYTMYIYF